MKYPIIQGIVPTLFQRQHGHVFRTHYIFKVCNAVPIIKDPIFRLYIRQKSFLHLLGITICFFTIHWTCTVQLFGLEYLITLLLYHYHLLFSPHSTIAAHVLSSGHQNEISTLHYSISYPCELVPIIAWHRFC